MKKKVFALTAAGVMLATALSANADSVLMKVAMLEDADLVSDTNLFRVPGSNGYGLVDMNGNALTGTIYTNGFMYDDNFITTSENVEGLNTSGALDLSGKTVVPFKYGDVKTLNTQWLLGFVLEEATADAYDYESWSTEGGYYKITQVDIYYAGDGEGKCVASLTRDQYIDADAYGAYINVKDRTTGVVSTYDSAFNQVATDLRDTYEEPEGYKSIEIYSENGQQGLKDADGNVIMEPAFRYVEEFHGDYAVVSTGEKEGLIDSQGNVIVDAVFDEIKTNYYTPAMERSGDYGSSYVANGYVAVVQDGKVGFVDRNGNITCQPKYAKDNVEINGASAQLADLEGNTILVAGDGVETVIADYDVEPLYNGSGMYYRTRDDDYNYGLIDWHGQEILPCEYAGMEITGDGKYIFVNESYESGTLYQLPALEPGADTAEPASDDGVEAPAETPAPAEEAPAETPAPAEEAPAETPAPAEEAAAASTDGGSAEAVNALLDSACTMITAGDYSSATSLLTTAKTLIGEGNSAVTVILDNAISMLGGEEVDGAAVTGLITSVKTLLS